MPFMKITKETKGSEEMVKCFSCSREAIILANACSPTSASGLTPTRPRCAECFVYMLGANIIHFLVPPKEAQEKFKEAFKWKKERDERLRKERKGS